MMRATNRRSGTPFWLGLGLIAGLPGLAEAQLFPNRTLTRERPSCAAEPPYYATVRQNYFGYYPTCWNKFPDGWQCPCPNPELPNRAAAFDIQKRDALPTAPPTDPDAMGEGVGDDMPVPLNPGRDVDPDLPAIPGRGRSPFNSDPTPPDADPAPGARTPGTPPQTSRAPGTARAAAPTTPATAPAASPALPAPSLPAATTGLLEMPRMLPPVAAARPDEPRLDPGMIALAPDATLASTDAAAAARAVGTSAPLGPELGIDPSLLNNAQPAPAATAPAQAPQRRGVLSGLFGSSKRRR